MLIKHKKSLKRTLSLNSFSFFSLLSSNLFNKAELITKDNEMEITKNFQDKYLFRPKKIVDCNNVEKLNK